ncbi:MAG: hypothetical protein KGI27_13990 [Thaumarchaeota archaeon]|nr:hypothetical protein [Nitrososphaerota archaeon]
MKNNIERQQAIETLKGLLRPGDTVYTVLRHVSRSGMQQSIDTYVIRDNNPRWISSLVSKAIGARFDQKREAVIMGGCGMDMGFEIVYCLSNALFKEGFECPGETCGSNDHFNDRSEAMRRENFKGHMHTGDGGYALNQKWM